MNSDRVRKAARKAVADYLNGRKLNNVRLILQKPRQENMSSFSNC